jgi:hypothetical protein
METMEPAVVLFVPFASTVLSAGAKAPIDTAAAISTAADFVANCLFVLRLRFTFFKIVILLTNHCLHLTVSEF